MYFGNGSQDCDFIFNRTKLPNSCEEKILGMINDKMSLIKSEANIRSAKADIDFLRL